jgi:hypothetical protein
LARTKSTAAVRNFAASTAYNFVVKAVHLAGNVSKATNTATATTKAGRASTPQALFAGQFGRVRTGGPSPDGGLWLTTSGEDKNSTANNSNDKFCRSH